MPRSPGLETSTALVAAFAVACLAAGASRAAEPDPRSVDAAGFPRHGLSSVSTADGALGAIVNPALIGLRYPSEMFLATTLDESSRAVAFDVLGAWRNVGARVTRVRGVERRIGFGAGFGGPALRGGWSAEWSKGDLGPSRIFDHRVGLLSRPVAWASAGATVEHLFQPRVAGGAARRDYTLALAVRPAASRPAIAHSVGPSLTLFGECRMPEQRRPRPEWRFGLEAEVLQGLALQAALDDEETQLGVVARLPLASVFGLFTPRSQTGSALRSILDSASPLIRSDDRRDHSLQTYALSLHSGEEPTRLIPPSARRIGVTRIGGPLGDDDVSGFSLLYGSESSVSVRPLHERLERALEDPLTRGVLLELGGAGNGAALEELRPRIARLRAAGKPVVAYLEAGGGRGDLLLASACDRVIASEEAMFWQLGLRAERRYYRRLLDDWGVRVDRSSIGAYKSAYRTWSADSTPPADREAIEHVLDSVQNEFVTTVSASRRMDPARLATILDGRQWPAEELVKAGLIDSVGYRETALATLGKLAGLGRRPRSIRLAAVRPVERRWAVARGLAIVYASGGIEMGESGNDLLNGPALGANTLVRQIEQAFRRKDVRAVVLRIESPGGSVLGSNLIHHALERMKRETKKPLVVSMGSVAASGGYYIALPGDRIFADRMTRTGSIGVVFVHPSLEGWYAKHGVRQEDFERGAFMRGGSLARDWDAATQASADSAIARTYDRFVDKVASSRGLERGRVLEAAQGRVWLGEDARVRGLVDEIGGLEAALAWAHKSAGLPAGERVEPVEFRRPRPGWLQRIAGSWLGAVLEREARWSLEPSVRFEAGGEFEF
ncbi:MAG: signal peptide peptidase SppA [Candidatus Eisenbacteria bacterium]